MSQERKSPLLQILGIDCFFTLVDEKCDNIPSSSFTEHHYNELHYPTSHDTQSTINSTLLSLVHGDVDLSLIVHGIKCIVEYYNLTMDAKQKE